MREKKNLQLALLCAGLFACAVPAAAQGVYRCGNTYSQQPCPGGKEVAVEDERSAAQIKRLAERAHANGLLGSRRSKTGTLPLSLMTPWTHQKRSQMPASMALPLLEQIEGEPC